MARTDGRGTGFYHADGNGNVSLLVDGAGDVLARYLYDPFGQLLGMWGPLAQANVYRFSSKPMDVWTGAYNFGYRDYQPNLQRWLSRDPLQERGGVNLYGYVGNNPVNSLDSLGLEGNPISSTLAGVSGAWNNDAAGGDGSFYGPGFFQSIEQGVAEAAQEAAMQQAMETYFSTPDQGEATDLSMDALAAATALDGIGEAFEQCPTIGWKGGEFTFTPLGKTSANFRVNPLGDWDSSNPFSRWPHYHRRPGIDKHRPWERWP